MIDYQNTLMRYIEKVVFTIFFNNVNKTIFCTKLIMTRVLHKVLNQIVYMNLKKKLV